MGGERQRGGRGEGEWAELFEWDQPMGGQECRSEWGDGRGGAMGGRSDVNGRGYGNERGRKVGVVI